MNIKFFIVVVLGMLCLAPLESSQKTGPQELDIRTGGKFVVIFSDITYEILLKEKVRSEIGGGGIPISYYTICLGMVNEHGYGYLGGGTIEIIGDRFPIFILEMPNKDTGQTKKELRSSPLGGAQVKNLDTGEYIKHGHWVYYPPGS